MDFRRFFQIFVEFLLVQHCLNGVERFLSVLYLSIIPDVQTSFEFEFIRKVHKNHQNVEKNREN